MKRHRTLAPLATAILVVSMVLSALTACSTTTPSASPSASPSSSPKSSPASSSPSSPPASASAKASSPEQQAYQKAQDDFKKVIEAARNEPEATIYSVFQLDILEALASAFNKVDPKIQIKFVRTIGAQAIERLRAEQATKQYVASGYLGGAPTTRQMHTDGMSMLIDVPVLHEPGVKWHISPTFDKPMNTTTVTFNKFLLLYNTDMVPAGQEPKTWKDLTNPRFKGQLVLWDPRISGPPRALFGLLYYDPKYGPDMVKTLSEYTVPVPDSATAARAVAKGEGAVTLATVAGYVEVKEAPVNVISPTDGTIIVPSQYAIPTNSPQVNTALVFANWLLSKEGQTVLGTGYGVLRSDVEAQDKLGQLLPGEKLLDHLPLSHEYEQKVIGEPIDMVKKWMAAVGR